MAGSRMITTFSGRVMDPVNSVPADFCAMDIAHALAMKCRYGGHCRFFYSVAQHSVLCAQAAMRAGVDARWALMHDAAEAYLCDVPAPVKSRLNGFAEIELRLLKSLSAWLGLPDPEPLPLFVRLLDEQIVSAEWEVLMPPSVIVNFKPVPDSSPLQDMVISPWGPEKSKVEFLALFRRFFPEHCGR